MANYLFYDDDFSKVPQKEMNRFFDDYKQTQVPTRLNENYLKIDESFRKIRKENSSRLKCLLEAVDCDIRKLLEFEINSIQKENDNLKCLVNNQKETILSLEDELENIKEEAMVLSRKLKQANEGKKKVEFELSSPKESFEKEFEPNMLKKKDTSSNDLLKKNINLHEKNNLKFNEKFHEEKGIIKGDIKKNLDVLVGPTSDAFSTLSLENENSYDDDDRNNQDKFTKEDLKDCRFFTKNGLPNMRYKENRIKFLNEGTKVNGEPDMRYKKNIEKLNRYYRDLYQNN